MKEVRLIATIANLDKPTRNGTYYSAECLAKAFEEPLFACANRNHQIPVTLSGGHPAGTATAQLDYPTIKVDMTVTLDECVQKVIESCGIAPTGFADMKYGAFETAEHYRMENVRLTGWDIVSYPSMSCSMEIVKE